MSERRGCEPLCTVPAARAACRGARVSAAQLRQRMVCGAACAALPGAVRSATWPPTWQVPDCMWFFRLGYPTLTIPYSGGQVRIIAAARISTWQDAKHEADLYGEEAGPGAPSEGPARKGAPPPT